MSIRFIHLYAFFGLTNVKYLNLSGNPITKIQNYIFAHLHDLRIIDLRDTKLLFIEKHSLFSPSVGTTIYLDSPVFCCYLSSHHRCHVNEVRHKDQECKQIIATKVTYIVTRVSAAVVIVLNLINVVLLQNRKISRSHLILWKHLNITNILPAFYLLFLCIASLLYNNNYIYINTEWCGSYLCNILYSLPEAGFISSRCCVFLIVLDQLIATRFALKQHRIRTIHLLCILYLSMILVVIWHIVRAVYINISIINCYPFIVTHSDSLLEWVGRVNVTAIGLCVISSTVFMYYVIIRTVQQSSCRIRSSNKTKKVVISIVQHASGFVGIEIMNLVYIALLLVITFYWYKGLAEHMSTLVSIMTLLTSSLHVVFFAIKQYHVSKKK